jgi:Na+/H+ antiporter NhaD/arsenite permease-like protein
VVVGAGNTRLAAAIVMIIWVGGTVGAFIDNIPFTQTMIPIVLRLTSGDLGLPLTPLVWALAYGCCMGGTAPHHRTRATAHAPPHTRRRLLTTIPQVTRR